MGNQDQTHNGPMNIPTIELIRYPTPISPPRPPVLTQQIMEDFQLSQEAWNKLSSQMNEMAETNKQTIEEGSQKHLQKTNKLTITIPQEGSQLSKNT